jgi:SAM-dependent methyltransferase
MRSSAATEGPEWSARAADWAELWSAFGAPAREVVVSATAVGPGTRLLDVGCGSGELCELAAQHGAIVSDIDAAEGMIEIARRRVPAADLRVGAMERLPWPDGSFDVVTAFNALQFAARFATALAEAARVARRGGSIAVCNWGRPEDRDLFAVYGPLGDLQPPPAPGDPSAPDPPAVGEPGVLEALAREAGLRPDHAGEVDVPYEAPDLATLERAIVDGAGFATAVEHSGAEAVRAAIARAAEPFRRPDGSYRLENRFRYVIARA